ncbi:hypothetical protein J3E69DRAFT_347982 [Trichoderma sp. SZMC 28015]
MCGMEQSQREQKKFVTFVNMAGIPYSSLFFPPVQRVGYCVVFHGGQKAFYLHGCNFMYGAFFMCIGTLFSIALMRLTKISRARFRFIQP